VHAVDQSLTRTVKIIENNHGKAMVRDDDYLIDRQTTVTHYDVARTL
jgi:hypothetical protein